MTPSAYAPQAEDFDLSEATTEELGQAIHILNLVSKAGARIDPRKSGSLSKKELKRASTMFAALRQARGAAAQYVIATVFELLDDAVDLAHFKKLMVERSGGDPRKDR